MLQMKSATRRNLPLRSRPICHLVKNTKGQLTIFFGITLIMLITITAFVINVGMYVRAKINLQNAVDTAAWAGAAVQARQLTDIAYLNWEMRNVYKEWMFKYYVLGQITLKQVQNPTQANAAITSPTINFRMEKYLNATGSNNDDLFSFPSICVATSGDNQSICRLYSVPGLPDFPALGYVGTDQTTQAFIDTIASQKSKDCIAISSNNQMTALNWAYSPKGFTQQGSAPVILSERKGAFPAALELAMRIRNLERIVNEPPVTLCTTTDMGTCQEFTSWQAQGGTKKPHMERSYKAFRTAVQNLGTPSNMNEMTSFKMQELESDTSYINGYMDNTTASYALVPKDIVPNYRKYYLDLRLFMINFATFYTAFVADGGSEELGKCSATKVALPVPAYPFGYEKNPKFLTYYAIKGESKFIGLLNPFADELPNLTAYAAAKPFGGRIGPKIFDFDEGQLKAVKLRGAQAYTSQNYAIGLKLGNRVDGGDIYTPGDAIPFSKTGFWATEADPIGGTPGGSATVKYVLPSLVYEYFSTMPLGVTVALPIFDPTKPNDKIDNGLFNLNQFKAFRNNLGPPKAQYTSTDVTNSIQNVRSPTRYDSYNYLIPTTIGATKDPDTTDNVPAVNPNSKVLKIYAPLYSSGGGEPYILYNSSTAVRNQVGEYLLANKPSIDTFINSMKEISDIMLSSAPADKKSIYVAASKTFYDTTVSGGSVIKCGTVAGNFFSFYYGDTSLAGGAQKGPNANDPPCSLSLTFLLGSYWGTMDPSTVEYYTSQFSYQASEVVEPKVGFDNPMFFHTAFMPGPRQGVEIDGTTRHPFLGGTQTNSRRNFYSTKLISIDRVKKQQDNNGFAILSEGVNTDFTGTGNTFTNILQSIGLPNKLNQ